MTNYCPGSGTLPNPKVTVRAQEEAVAAYDRRSKLTTFREYYGDADPLWGRQGCGNCGKVYLLKRDGTLPNHKGVQS